MKAWWEVEEPGALPSADPLEQRLPREPGVFLELQARSGCRQTGSSTGRPKACTHRDPSKSPRNHPHVSFGAILTPGCLYKALDSFPKGAAFRREANSWGRQAAAPTQLVGTSTSQGSAFSKGRETHPTAGKEGLVLDNALDNGSWQGFGQSQPKPLSEMCPTNTQV